MILRILTKTASRMARFLCNYRGKRFAEVIEQSVDAFHRRLNNVDFDMERNGELRVLRILSQFHSKCIFDIGANKGDWIQLASKMNPSCIIHAFEIVPSTYEELLQNTKELSNVIPNNYGLSSKEENISISLGNDSSTATGCKIQGMRFHNEYYNQKIKCPTRKASNYIREQNIDCIDFVKIDVEGMDLQVIKGFEDQLKNVRVVQFEYGIFNISSHDLLADFCLYLKSKGFAVGKIFPKHVNFIEYHYNMENFHGSNYVAVRNDETLLIDKLQSYSA